MNKKPLVRTEYIGIRVTPEEKAALLELAAAAGMSLTSFLLGCALGEVEVQRYSKIKEP